MPDIVNTEVTCPVCKKGIVVVELEWSCDVPRSEVIYGPGGASQFSWKITGIYCGGCDVTFRNVPGNPNMAAEILDEKVYGKRPQVLKGSSKPR